MSSGLKQDSDGSLYMLEGVKRIDIASAPRINTFELRHHWYMEHTQLVPKPCGNENCSVCKCKSGDAQ